MASVTLVESAKLSQNQLVAGVIENVYTVDELYRIFPFDDIEGNALVYNRENALGDVQVLGVGGTITAKAAATFTSVTASLTTIIGDAEVNGLIQATRSGITDQKAQQVASKAKSAGRKYRDMLVNGTGGSDEFSGMLALVAGGQTIIQDTAGVTTDGGPLSFAKLDELLDLVKAKDGRVDFIQMARRTRRSFFALLRALGGATIEEAVNIPGIGDVPAYRKVPIFVNENMPTNQTQGATTTCTSVIAGCIDDGSRKVGVAGLTARGEAGIRVVNIGEAETKDENITRVKWYAGFAVFNEKAIAVLKGVNN